jgi:tetratricopeptide (TPR) repeat protein
MNQTPLVWRILVLGALLTVLPSPSARSQAKPTLAPPSVATIEVHVSEAGGGPLAVSAEVRLFSPYTPGGLIQTTGVGGATIFNTMEGSYKIEVRAAGYQTANEDVSVFGGGATHCYIVMRQDDGSAPPQKASGKPGIPEVPGKSRKELDLAFTALRDNKTAEANKHVEYALKHTKDNPEVQYVAALCALAANDLPRARQYLESAVSVFPQYSSAQMVLGGVLLQQGATEEAIAHLQRAVAADPNAWRSHRTLSEAYLRANRDFDKAKFHAQRALEVGKEKAVGAEITLALAETAGGDRDAGRTRLERFLFVHSDNPEAARARALLAGPMFSPQRDAVPIPVSAIAPAPAPAASVLADVPHGPIRHLPSAVDALVPPVDAGVSCSLPQVLQGAALRAGEFTDALERFTATETFSHDDLDENGAVRKSYNDSFQYLAALKWPRRDLMILTEVRNGGIPVFNLPVPYVTEGLPSIGLVFHAAHAPNFQFTCEGLGSWRGQPAWQLHFEQRPDRPAQIHDWSEKGQSYPVILKGRAWISTGAYHLLRVETDLVKPIPEVRLELHHMTIEYAAVKASNGKELWLPSYAEVFSRFRGRFFRQQHDFGDFVLFSVDSNEKIKPQ